MALRHDNEKKDAIKLQETATLSLGTGQSVSSMKLADPNAGAFQWVGQDPQRLISILMQSPTEIQSAIGEYLLFKVNSSSQLAVWKKSEPLIEHCLFTDRHV